MAEGTAHGDVIIIEDHQKSFGLDHNQLIDTVCNQLLLQMIVMLIRKLNNFFDKVINVFSHAKKYNARLSNRIFPTCLIVLLTHYDARLEIMLKQLLGY